MENEESEKGSTPKLNKDEIQKKIKKGRKLGREQGISELQGNFNYFNAHAINEDHLLEMFHDYFLQCQNDFSGLRSYYKSAVLSFRQYKNKILPAKWLHDLEVKPVSQEELDYISEMYLVFAKTKPDFGSGINIEEELEDLEKLVFEFEKIQIKKFSRTFIFYRWVQNDGNHLKILQVLF